LRWMLNNTKTTKNIWTNKKYVQSNGTQLLSIVDMRPSTICTKL
jgi:hypothetical protein